MPLYRPSELLDFLQNIQAAPNKRLSQNFLIDGNIISKIVNLADPVPGDHFLEIGPGPGVLTEALLQKEVQITAVEKDPLFAKALERFPKVVVHATDILEFDFNSLDAKKRFKVAANLPYHLTSPILNHLLPRYDLFERVTVMVQEEVALRIVAQPSSQDYSSLSVFVNVFSDPIYGFHVSRNCFYPRPKVDSAVVSFLLKKPLLDDVKPFLEFVRLLFCHRRKMIRTTLASKFPKEKIDQALKELRLETTVRPENLSCQQLMDFFELLNRMVLG